MISLNSFNSTIVKNETKEQCTHYLYFFTTYVIFLSIFPLFSSHRGLHDLKRQKGAQHVGSNGPIQTELDTSEFAFQYPYLNRRPVILTTHCPPRSCLARRLTNGKNYEQNSDLCAKQFALVVRKKRVVKFENTGRLVHSHY